MTSTLAFDSIARTLSALPSDRYELGIRNEKTDKMMLRLWDRETILADKTIGFLKARNAAQEHIYIRPASPHQFTLLDDIDRLTINRLENTGFSPCLVIQTSPNNFQAWLNHGEVLSNELSTFVAQYLSTEFNSDPGSADYRHFGRLPGFTNPKEIYFTGIFYPFVKLEKATNAIYSEASFFIEKQRLDFESLAKELKRIKESSAKDFNKQNLPISKTVEDFYNNPRYDYDCHRADLAFCVYAINRGMNQSELFDLLLRARDLSKKGNVKRQSQYVERTIEKALKFT
ncbi:MAG: hypothetical protein GY941_01115 [Planctomycetes bacterium]|nr:hypothetical protein [Planctomycetota bacterium]